MKPIPIPKEVRKLAEKIQDNNPFLQLQYTQELSWIFINAGKTYKINPKLLAAIAMQESSYTLDAKQCYVTNHKLHCDYCMMQIYDKTAETYGFNIRELMDSETLCINAGARILGDLKKRYGKKDKNWWSRYNAITLEKRETYQELVERFL